MIRKIIRMFSWFALCAGIVALIVVATYLAPGPLRFVDYGIAALTMILIIHERGSIVWVAFCVYGALELFSLAPFGIMLGAGTLTWLFSFWLYEYFFTNQSWYTAMAISGIATLMYRLLLYGAWSLALITQHEPNIATTFFFLETLREISATVLLTGAMYGIFSLFKKQVPQYRIFLHT